MRLVTFNLANGQPNDLVAVNPDHVRAITLNSDSTTKIWLSLDDFWIVCGRFQDVLSLLIRESNWSPAYEAAFMSDMSEDAKNHIKQNIALERAFRKGQP
jgi:hypothetical protein